MSAAVYSNNSGTYILGKGSKMTDSAKSSVDSLKEADSLFQDREMEAAFAAYDKAHQKAREEFNRPVEVEALAQMARLTLSKGDSEEGEDWLDKARERADESDPLGWSRFLGVEGRFAWKAGNIQVARETFEQMFDYCSAKALWGRAVDAAHMVAIVAESREDQIKWSHIGIEMAETHNSNRWLGPLWNNLAGVYYDNKQYDSCLACYHKARDYHWQFSGETEKLFADYHVGLVYRLKGEFENAEKWLRPVLAWAERLDNHSAIGQTCEDLGEIEFARGNKPAGIQLLKRAREEYQKAGFDKSWPEIWNNISKRLEQVEE